ncbi:MAG: hypothetical protein KKC79_19385 [Gammaproteobacteria bacterium]|nr:hypothetical protein [Gammaproteobacteria bacterium]MBU1443918.1 hypothetical protein [Gammaproteobacteria bacterium]MBU2285786.1 hypothetical protein [Gammaproteobacteria bacterium]MBU2410802.1 hypothetical protein [Gammaproteobacteria bacterium]
MLIGKEMIMSRKLGGVGRTKACNACLGWAAGFLDGEGCIRIARRNPGGNANRIYSLEIVITQNCLRTLEHFQSTLGIQSSIYVFPCQGAVRSTVYALTYRCTRARAVLEALHPYLVRKQREAEVGIEFADRATFARKGRRRHSPEEIAIREDYYWKLRALKPRGPNAVVQ